MKVGLNGAWRCRCSIAIGAPLFSCPDQVVLMEGVNDLSVTCLIVSTEDIATSVTVRVGSRQNITMQATLGKRPVQVPYEKDTRYVIDVKPDPSIHTGVRML